MIKNNFISDTWLRLSLLNAGLVTFTSLIGIFNLATYSQETNNWAMQAVGQDIANLIVVPILLISTLLLTWGSLRAYLIWLGVYIYFIYAFVIYAFSVHFNFLFLAYIAILGLSVYIPVGSLLEGRGYSLLKSKKIIQQLYIKQISVLLMAIGIMFSLLWLSEIIPHLLSGTTPQSLNDTGLWTNPVYVLDLGLLLPSMIITAVILWQGKLLGYFLAVPLLVFSATMGIGIVILFILRSINEGKAIAMPAYIIGFIIFLSIYYSYRFLNNISH